jgi:hypothetical protein
MRVKVFLINVFIFAASAAASNAYAANLRHGAKNIPVTKDEKEFVHSLQVAFKKNDCNWVANRVLYPIRVESTENGFIQIKTASKFVQDCSEILSDNVRQAVLHADIEKLIKSSKGIYLGDGDIWLMSLSRKESDPIKVYIVGINNRVDQQNKE